MLKGQNFHKCCKRFKKSGSIFQKTLHLPKTTLPLRRKNVADFERDIQKACSFDELYKWQWNNKSDENKYILHDGPPYANGNVHVGHAMNKILKDIIVRHKILKGHKVQYKPGWDCHGLPIETKAIKTDQTFSLSPVEIRKRARRFAAKTAKKQLEVFKKWGVTADWSKEGCYYTFDKHYEVAETEAFYEMYKKKLIFRDLKPVNWSPTSQTALAEGELEYNDNHVSKSAFFGFPLTAESKYKLGFHGDEDVSFMSWTTQPWTVPGNKALGVGKGMKYGVVDFNSKKFIVASESVEELNKNLDITFNQSASFVGADLLECTYHNPLDQSQTGKVVNADHVTKDGTGLVHLAPGHGKEDFDVAKQHDLPTESIVGGDGKLNSNVSNFEGLEGKFVFTDANSEVIKQLDYNDNLLMQQDYIHKYPYDWRSKTPIIIRTSKQWFIDTSPLMDMAQQSLDGVNFLHDHGKSSMLGHLKQRDFWCISRQRAWGIPIPTFYNKSTDEPVINEHTIDHLTKLFGQSGADAWWNEPMSELLPDHVIERSGLIGSSNDYRRGDDILDIWFDSGVSWYSVLGKNSPQADLYLEGRDQYNGWFYSSLMTHLGIRGNHAAPFKNLYTHGFVLDGKGQKMSKSLGNVVDPQVVINGGKNLDKNPQFGVDVLRWWVSESNTFKDVRIGNEGLKNIQKSVQKIRSCLRFMLSNINNLDPKLVEEIEFNKIDAYFLNKFHVVAEQVDRDFEEYNFARASQAILNLVHTLSSKYFTIIKDRLYCERSTKQLSAMCALQLMHTNLMRMCAPVLPHLVEEVHLHQTDGNDQESFFKTWDNSQFELLKIKSQQITPTEMNNFDKLMDIRNKFVSVIDTSPTAYDVTISAVMPEYEFLLDMTSYDVREVIGSSNVHRGILDPAEQVDPHTQHVVVEGSRVRLSIEPSTKMPCPRCRLHTSEKAGELCHRCADVITNPWDEEKEVFSENNLSSWD